MWKFVLYRSTQSFGSRVVLLQEHKSALPRVHRQDTERGRGWECVCAVGGDGVVADAARVKMQDVECLFFL